jgi:hypothetical protein
VIQKDDMLDPTVDPVALAEAMIASKKDEIDALAKIAQIARQAKDGQKDGDGQKVTKSIEVLRKRMKDDAAQIELQQQMMAAAEQQAAPSPSPQYQPEEAGEISEFSLVEKVLSAWTPDPVKKELGVPGIMDLGEFDAADLCEFEDKVGYDWPNEGELISDDSLQAQTLVEYGRKRCAQCLGFKIMSDSQCKKGSQGRCEYCVAVFTNAGLPHILGHKGGARQARDVTKWICPNEECNMANPKRNTDWVCAHCQKPFVK